MPGPILFTGAAAAALIALHPARAEDAPRDIPVGEVVVTAARGIDGVPAGRIGSSVTVLTPQDLEDRQVRIVSDVLRDVPGFAVSRAGPVGGFTQVRVRGTESNHVLTLIDGIEAADPFQGEFDFATLAADDVGRIEILRGPQSALYGSDAIGGVINIITPGAAEAPGGRLRVEAGTQDSWGGAGRWAQVSGPVDYVLTAGLQHTGGYVTQTLPGGRRHTGADLGSLSGKAAWTVSDQLKLRAVARYADTRADTNDSSFGRGLVDSPGSRYSATSLYGLAAADLSLMDGAWTQSVQIQGVDARRSGQSQNVRSSGDKGRRVKLSYITVYRFRTGDLDHALTGAVDRETETYQNTSPPSAGADTTRRSVHDTGLVGQYDLTWTDGGADRAGVGAAVRHDANDAFADVTTWKAQGYVRVAPPLRLRAAAGTGLKNPGQTELFGYNATGPFPFRGNPDLKPETSRGWEAGADLNLLDGRVRLGVTRFHARLKNEIFAYFGGAAPAGCPVPPAGTSTTCNRAFDSIQKGVELTGDLRLAETLTVSAAYTDLNARENGLQEIRRAPHIGSVNVTWTPLDGRARVNLTVRRNGAQLDSNFTGIAAPFPAGLPAVRPATGPDAGKVVLPAFTLLNLSAAYDVTPTVQLFGRIENLTRADYYEVFGYPTAPRSAAVGARVSF